MVPIGGTHISLPLHQIQSREQEKKEQTNKHLGLTQVQKESHITLCKCRLTLAGVTSETSTKQLECRLILTRSSFTGLDPISCRLVSPLRCPVSTASIRPPSPTAPRDPLSNQLSSRVPFHFRSRWDLKSKNPLSGFAPKQRNRLLGGPPT